MYSKENGKTNENSWTSEEHEMFYYDSKGKILGSIMKWNNKYKALLDIMFLGWFVSEETAKSAVETAWLDKQFNSNKND